MTEPGPEIKTHRLSCGEIDELIDRADKSQVDPATPIDQKEAYFGLGTALLRLKIAVLKEEIKK